MSEEDSTTLCKMTDHGQQLAHLTEQLEHAEEHYTVARFHLQRQLDKVIDLGCRLARTGQSAFVDPGYRFVFKRKMLRKLDRLEEEFEEGQHRYREMQSLRAKLAKSTTE